MATKEAFEAARNVYAFYQAYVGTVAQELGPQRTAELETKMCEGMGLAQGQMARQQPAIEEFDAQAAYAVAGQLISGLGFQEEVLEAGPQAVVFKAGRCPIYDAALLVGMEPQMVEARCHSGEIRFMNTLLKQLNPRLRYELREFRPSLEGTCIEAIVMD